jgi:NAD(P)-dependent dehydrogenase (short-subunit alcohol dehydrogenase family)
MTANELAGKVAVVTGAAKGIGRSIAAELAAAGARVVIADVAGGDEAAAALRADGLDAVSVSVDVSSPQSTQALADSVVASHGGIDILVNNAGIFANLTPKGFEEIDVDEWRKVMDVNVLGCFLMVKALVPSMRARGGGRIVNIGSTSSFKGVAFLLHYVSSKGAVNAMTRGLARELGPDSITVNSVAPGFTLSDGVLENEHSVERMRASAPGGRVLHREMTPTDVIGAVRFFSGPGAAFVTGQTLVVDGGAYFH